MKTTFFQTLFSTIILFTTVYSQTSPPQPLFFSTPMSFYGGSHDYDMVGNEQGFHLVTGTGGAVTYYLFKANGDVLWTANLGSGKNPAITTVISGVENHLYVVYKNDSYVFQIYKSTDAGKTWDNVNTRSDTSAQESNRIKVTSFEDRLHITWDTYNSKMVYYANIQLPQMDWSDQKLVTNGNEGGKDSVGKWPTVVVSKMNDTTRVHIIYVSWRCLGNILQGPPPDSLPCQFTFERMVQRNFNMQSGTFEAVDIKSSLFPQFENPYDNPSNNPHYWSKYTSPVATTSDKVYIAYSWENDDYHGGNEYTDSSMDNLNATPDDEGDNNFCAIPDGEEYNGNNAIHYDSLGNKVCWVNARIIGNPNRLILDTIVGSIASFLRTLDTSSINFHSLPMLSSKKAFSKFILWRLGSIINGFCEPRDITSNINVNTFWTYNNRIGKNKDISINNGVTAVVWDTLALDTASTLHVRGNLEVRGILAVQKDCNLIVEPNAQIIIRPGGRIILYNSGLLNCKADGIIHLQNGSIEFNDTAYATIYNPLGLRGTGIISNAQINWMSDFHVNDTTNITFINGGNLSFGVNGVVHNMDINGHLFFEGSSKPYQLQMDSLAAIFVRYGGTLETRAGTTLTGIPSIQAYYPSTLNSYGTDRDSCRWGFTQRAPCDVYGNLIGRYTHFHGVTINNVAREWQGIMVGYEGSFIDLDHCAIDDIYVNNPSGSGIHLYAANNMNNCVRNSSIRRLPDPRRPYIGDPKAGDGVFLQPGLLFSRIKLINDSIYSHWWAGFTSVTSRNYLDSNFIFCNIRGVGTYNYSRDTLLNNCISNHNIDGVHTEGSFLYLGYQELNGMNRIGNNMISENSSKQLDLFNSYIEAGFDDPSGAIIGGFNDVSHTISSVKRITSFYTFGIAEYNWWNEVPSSCGGQYGFFDSTQANRLFSITPDSSLSYHPALCNRGNIRFCSPIDPCNMGSIAPIVFEELRSDEDNFTQHSFRKTMIQPIHLAALFKEIRKQIRRNNFSIMYNALNDLMQYSSSKKHALFASRLALFCELEHVGKYPDSTQRSFTRLISFLNSHYNSSSDHDVKSVFLKTVSDAFFTSGDLTASENKLNQLFSNYPTTESAKQALWLKQIIAMAKRDSADVDTTINRMIRAGYSSDDLRVAKTMRYGFLRVKPKDLVTKRMLDQTESESTKRTPNKLLALTSLHNYPNPLSAAGRLSTVIEYYLPQSSHVTLKVFSLLGKEIQTIVDSDMKEGKHTVDFVANHSLPSGMYFYILTTDYGNVVRKMSYVK